MHEKEITTFSQNWHSKLSPPEVRSAGVALDWALQNGVTSHISSSILVSTLIETRNA